MKSGLLERLRAFRVEGPQKLVNCDAFIKVASEILEERAPSEAAIEVCHKTIMAGSALSAQPWEPRPRPPRC
jgi:hypothetical protein